MKARIQSLLAVVLICGMVMTSTGTASARGVRRSSTGQVFSGNIGPGTGVVVGVVVGIGAVGALIGVSVYYAAKHNKSVTGCVRTGASGLELANEGDQQSYSLIGDVAGIKDGERVRVSGKKRKGKKSEARQFLVEKVGRDFGACKAALAGIPSGSETALVK